MYLYFFAQATNTASAATAAAPTAQAPFWATIIPWIPAVIAGYFLLFRPQAMAQKKQAEILKNAKTGDKIVTTGGIHGVISNVKDTTVIVKVSDNVKLEVEKSHIDKVLSPPAAVVTSTKV